MGYLFPVNPIARTKMHAEEGAPIEKIGDSDKNAKDNRKQQDSFDHEEDKIKKMIINKKILEAIEFSVLNNEVKYKLMDIVKNVVVLSLLKKELLSIARNIFSISVEKNIYDEVDEKDLDFSDYLSRLIMKLSVLKKSPCDDRIAKKMGKANPIEDKNAGFLVHYCKDILNKKVNQQKNRFKLEKINKKDIEKFLKK